VSTHATRAPLGAVNNVSQQLGAALGVAVISTFVANRHSHYHDPPRPAPPSRHRARLHRRLLVGRRPFGGCCRLRCLIPRRHMLHQEGRTAHPLDEISGPVLRPPRRVAP